MAEERNEEAQEKPLVEVELLQRHTHQNRDYDPGTSIMVTEDERKFLQDNGVVAGNETARADVGTGAPGTGMQATAVPGGSTTVTHSNPAVAAATPKAAR